MTGPESKYEEMSSMLDTSEVFGNDGFDDFSDDYDDDDDTD